QSLGPFSCNAHLRTPYPGKHGSAVRYGGEGASHRERMPTKRSQNMAYDPNQPVQEPSQSQQPVPQGPIGQQFGPSSIGIRPNLAAAISYFWVLGLIFLVMEKKSRFVRFHAIQGLFLGLGLYIVESVLNFFRAHLGSPLLFVWLAIALFAAVQAYCG